jgi:hypothetical protein
MVTHDSEVLRRVLRKQFPVGREDLDLVAYGPCSEIRLALPKVALGVLDLALDNRI